MALSFLSLPPEVRNEIYGYIFKGKCEPGLVHVYAKCFATKSGYWDIDTRSRTKSDPQLKAYWTSHLLHLRSSCAPIVRTCQQVYRETNTLLYARATFVYRFWEGPRPVFNLRIRPCVFQKESLQYVKNLEILLDPENSVPLDIIVEATTGLIDEACALERLTVKSKIYDSYTTGTDAAWMRSILQNEGVLKSIMTSKSLHYVRIIVDDEVLTDGTDYAALSRAIASVKGWVCEAQETKPGGFRSDWSWYLRPASRDVNTGSVKSIS